MNDFLEQNPEIGKFRPFPTNSDHFRPIPTSRIQSELVGSPPGGGFRPIPTKSDWSEMVGNGRNWSEMVGNGRNFQIQGFFLDNHSHMIHSRSSNKSALIYIGSVCNLFIYLVMSIINIDLIAFYLHLYRRLEIISIFLHNQNIG